MSESTRRVSVRLSVAGAQETRAALQEVGEAGQRSLERIASGSTAASQALGALATLRGPASGADLLARIQSGADLAQQGVERLGGAFAGLSPVLGTVGSSAGRLSGLLASGGGLTAALGAVGIAATAAYTVFQNWEAITRAVGAAVDFLTGRVSASATSISALGEASRTALQLLETAEQRTRRLRADALTAAQQSLTTERLSIEGEIAAAEQRLSGQTRAARQGEQLDATIAALEANPNRTLPETAILETLRRQQAAVSREAAAAAEALRNDPAVARLTQAIEDRRRQLANNAALAGRLGKELAALRAQDTGPPVPEGNAPRGGAGGAAARPPRDPPSVAAAWERELNEALRERDALLRTVQTPYEQYQERLTRLAEVQERLTTLGRPLSNQQVEEAAQRFGRELEEAERRAQGVDRIGQQLGLTFSSAFEDAVLRGRDLSDVLQGIEQDLARIILRSTVTQPLGNAISGAVQGIDWGGILRGITSLVPSALGNVFAGGAVVQSFAAGGAFVGGRTLVPMAEMGEAGPEAVFPLARDGAGRLGVRAELGGGGGRGWPGGLTIHQTITVDARGADPAVDAKIRLAVAAAVQQANAQLIAEIRRGGAVAREVGRR